MTLGRLRRGDGVPGAAVAGGWPSGVLIVANPIAVRSAWFGQNDAPSLTLMMLAFALATRGRYRWAAASLAGAVLLKQFAVVAIPFLALMMFKQRGRAGGAQARAPRCSRAWWPWSALPFLIADPGAFYDDTVKFGAGTYKIVGYGLSAMLVRAGILDDRDGSYPFALIALLTWLPLTAWLLVQAHRARELWVAAAGFSISILVLLFIGRTFNNYYLVWPMTGAMVAALIYAGERQSRTFVLIHGAGDTSWYWHLVVPELRERGHDAVAVDLPSDDDSAGLAEYADAVVDAVGERTDLAVVAQSLGGFTGGAGVRPLAGGVGGAGRGHGAGAGRDLLGVGGQYRLRGFREGDPIEIFMHDVPPDLAAEAMTRGRDQSGTPLTEPWPLDAWPDVPTRYVLGTEDRCFPPEFTRRMVRERLGIPPDEIETSHCVRPQPAEGAGERLVGYLGSERVQERAPGQVHALLVGDDRARVLAGVVAPAHLAGPGVEGGGAVLAHLHEPRRRRAAACAQVAAYTRPSITTGGACTALGIVALPAHVAGGGVERVELAVVGAGVDLPVVDRRRTSRCRCPAAWPTAACRCAAP